MTANAKKPRTKGRNTKIKTLPWDSAAYLRTTADIAGYLEAVFEDGDPALVAAALGDVARSKGMAKIARSTGLGRESLYKALSPDGNPELATVLKVLRALGLRLKVAA
ncbi:MAG: addiction module antidote protein [Xanthobacteraceae bacterium]|jgi:probable addiction module antidote protein